MNGNTLITIILAISISFLFLYRYLKKLSKFWEQLGIPYWKPDSVIFGNIKNVILNKSPAVLFHIDIYKKLFPHKFGGIFILRKPTLVIRDPELIKHVLTKDFSYFSNREMSFKSKSEPLTNNLFNLKDEEWKNLRAKLTSTFTSGKMKLMFPLIDECAKQLCKKLQNFLPNDDIDIKDLIACYGTDVIGTCAFGLSIRSLENPNSEFRLMGKAVFKNQYKMLIRMLVPNISPIIIKFFNLQIFQKDVEKYFTNVVRETVKYREENGVRRNDFLDILIALKNDTDQENNFLTDMEHKSKEEELLKCRKIKIDMTPELMAAQCFLFFVAGYEASSTVTSFMLLELAKNSSIQEKLYNEITTVLMKYDNKLTYESLKYMKYLDMVLAETMRKFPAATILSRECSKDYKIPDSNVTIPKGTGVLIPVFGLHVDEQYYPNPDKFNPENFTEEAKLNRPQYSYLPFGEGPRVCIAERFARMQMKAAAVHIIKNFKFHVSPRMKFPEEFENGFSLMYKGGIWLQCTKRNFVEF